MTSLRCLLGFHKWVYKHFKTYPRDRRVCVRCLRQQELVYDLLTKWWDTVEGKEPPK